MPANDSFKQTHEDAYVDSSDSLKKYLAEVFLTKGSEFDDYLFSELAISNYNMAERNILMTYIKGLRLYLQASTTNPRSKRTYDCRMNARGIYAEMRSIAITAKGQDGWITDRILNPKVTQEQRHIVENWEPSDKQKKEWENKRKLEP